MDKCLLKKVFLFTGLLFGASSCVDDSYDLDNMSNDVYLDYETYMPLAHSTVTLSDFLKKVDVEEVEEREDGMIYFVYDTTASFLLDPIKLNLKQYKYTTTVGSALPGFDPNIIPSGMSAPGIKAGEVMNFPIDVQIEIDENTGTGRIDKVLVKEATFKFQLISKGIPDLNRKIRIEIEVPENVVTGGLDEKMSWDPETGEASYTLDEATLTMNSDVLPVNFKLVVLEDIELSSEEIELSLIAKKTKIKYYTLYGAFTHASAQHEKSELLIDIFHNKNMEYNLTVKDPRVRMDVFSNCGIPLRAEITSLMSKNTDGGVYSSVFRDGETTYKYDFDYAREENTVEKAFSEVFDKDNGSIDKLFNNHPDSLFINCSYVIDGPLDSGETYFLQDTTRIQTRVTAEVPFWLGNDSYIISEDTIKGIDIVDELGDYQKEDYAIEVAEIFIDFENRLPLDAYVSAQFVQVDTVVVNGEDILERKVIDSVNLDQSVKLEPAVIDPVTSRVLSSSLSKKSIKVIGAQVEDMKKIDEIIIRYKVSLPAGENGVKISGDCSLSAKAYAHVKANITVKND